MTIHFLCPQCGRGITSEPEHAGLSLKCPQCSHAGHCPTTPADARTIPRDDFDFDGPSAEERSVADVPAEARDAWRAAGQGLRRLWWGTCLQLMSVFVVPFLVVGLLGSASNLFLLVHSVDNFDKPELVKETRTAAEQVVAIIAGVVIGGTALLGTALKFLGLAGCARVPEETEARGLARVIMVAEVLTAAGMVLVALGIYVHRPLATLGEVLAQVSILAAMCLLIVYILRIEEVLDSTKLRKAARSFRFWYAGLIVFWVIPFRLLPLGGVATGVALAALIVGTQIVPVIVFVLPSAVLIKYLGLLNTGEDEIRRRFGVLRKHAPRPGDART